MVVRKNDDKILKTEAETGMAGGEVTEAGTT